MAIFTLENLAFISLASIIFLSYYAINAPRFSIYVYILSVAMTTFGYCKDTNDIDGNYFLIHYRSYLFVSYLYSSSVLASKPWVFSSSMVALSFLVLSVN